MATPTNAARAGVAACWIPALLIPGPDLEDGITQSFAEPLPGSFATSREALEVAVVAVVALGERPDAMGATAKRQGGAA